MAGGGVRFLKRIDGEGVDASMRDFSAFSRTRWCWTGGLKRNVFGMGRMGRQVWAIEKGSAFAFHLEFGELTIGGGFGSVRIATFFRPEWSIERVRS